MNEMYENLENMYTFSKNDLNRIDTLSNHVTIGILNDYVTIKDTNPDKEKMDEIIEDVFTKFDEINMLFQVQFTILERILNKEIVIE